MSYDSWKLASDPILREEPEPCCEGGGCSDVCYTDPLPQCDCILCLVKQREDDR